MISNNYWQQGDADSSKEYVTKQGNQMINAPAQVPAEVLNDAGLQKPFAGIVGERFAKAAPPEAPSRVAASGGDSYAYVTSSPSVQEGGSPVSEYMVRVWKGAEARISNKDFWKYIYLKMTRLPNGPLTFTVSAVNAQGRSVASLPARAVTLQAGEVALPGAPENVSVRTGRGAGREHSLPVAGGSGQGKPGAGVCGDGESGWEEGDVYGKEQCRA
jgi:hypothetical protein